MVGHCKQFEERQIGKDRFNFVYNSEDVQEKSVTLLLRGGAEQFLEESERSINDAIMVVNRVRSTDSILPGGGAIELELSKLLRNYAYTLDCEEH